MENGFGVHAFGLEVLGLGSSVPGSGVRVSSLPHTKCFEGRFAEVNSRTNLSTCRLLLLTYRISGRICAGIDFRQTDL